MKEELGERLHRVANSMQSYKNMSPEQRKSLDKTIAELDRMIERKRDRDRRKEQVDIEFEDRRIKDRRRTQAG